MPKPYIMVPLTRDQFEAVYSEIIAGLLTTEEQSNKTKDIELLSRLMNRIATLNVVLEKMDPHASHSLLGHAERDSTRIGGEEPPSGQKWR